MYVFLGVSKKGRLSMCVCVCPCIVARQIQPSTWLTSDISVSSPRSCHHRAASFSPATQGEPPPPPPPPRALKTHSYRIFSTVNCPFFSSPPHYCCIFTEAASPGYLRAIMTATCKHSSLSLASAKACRVGPGHCNNSALYRAGSVHFY